jgi:2-succinyl-6-hydroxy-2,4-cyclohexadiene-1-carboxylate synthase
VSDRRIDVGGLSLAVTERGSEHEGLPVVLLHGFTGCAASMAEVAEALALQHRTLCVDLVGHGRSDAPEEVAPYAMDACVVQLERLLDALGIERAHWLGYSMGGRAALQLANVHPERVARMVLVGASAGLSDPDARTARVASDEALATRIAAEGLEAFVDAWMALPLFASQKRLGEVALAAARAQRLENSVCGLGNSLRGMGTGAQSSLQSKLSNLEVPVCLVVGDEDSKFQGIASELASQLPNARIASIPESGHAAHLENPEAFADVVRGFFAEETAA